MLTDIIKKKISLYALFYYDHFELIGFTSIHIFTCCNCSVDINKLTF